MAKDKYSIWSYTVAEGYKHMVNWAYVLRRGYQNGG